MEDDITGTWVHCAKCTSFDLCLQCFAAGAEIGEHRNDHAYQFMDSGTTILSIFRGKGAWSAREELRLLDAIENDGFGNWEDISKHIETRSAEEAEEVYVSKFVNGTIGKHTWTPAQSQRPKIEDHTAEEDNGPLGTNFVAKLLKLAQADIYTRRLRERARRKRIVRDYQLVANFFRSNNNKNRYNREQREFRDRFRVFAQFYTAQEYESRLASIERERELRIRLSELNRYRWNGLTRLDECVHFEQHAAAAQHKNTGPYGHGRTDNPTIGNRHGSYLHSPHNKKVEIANENERSSSSIGQKAPLARDVSNFATIAKPGGLPGSPDISTRPRLRRSRSVGDLRDISTRTLKRAEPTLAPIPAKLSHLNLHTSAPARNGPPVVNRPRTTPASTASAASSNNSAGFGNKTTIKKTATTSAPKLTTKKIPAYDYKARFNDLLEKHKVLKKKFEDAKEELCALDTLPEQYEECQSELYQTKQDLKSSESLAECLQKQNSTQEVKIASLTKCLMETKEKLDELIKQYEKITKEHTEMSTELITLRERCAAQTEMVEFLNNELDECKDQLFNANIERKEREHKNE